MVDDQFSPPVERFLVDVARDRRTICQCGTRFRKGDVRVCLEASCRAYGTTVSRRKWYHVACRPETARLESATGIDALDGVAKEAVLSSKPHSQQRCKRKRSADDPSFSAKRKNSFQRFAGACRLAVRAQTEAFREAFFRTADIEGVACPITQEVLTRSNCEVHHVSSEDQDPDAFHCLVKDFVAERKVNVSATEYLCGHLLDTMLREAFMDFHARNAALQCVSRQANRGVLRRKSNEPRRPDTELRA
mmetsp:Transcript_28832/g.94213  ORF Transcript_28832/g.94213 Transcript_28832/m.94213 type:complete len:248 (-) Transcript_28832:133-876(-)